jgi:DNA modification methylase
MSYGIVEGNALRLPFASRIAHTCVTSPPYWGQREYIDLPPLEWPAVTFNPGVSNLGASTQVASAWAALVDALPPLRHADWTCVRQAFDEHVAPLVQAETVTIPGCAPHCEHVWGAPQVTGQWCQRCGGWRGHLGNEPDPLMYVGHLVLIFREVRRVLRDDATLWLNVGDAYVTRPGNGCGGERVSGGMPHRSGMDRTGGALATKNLFGLPWRVALALQADGWWLRSDIPWLKTNALPESVRDRLTHAHEYFFLLSPSARYYYDPDAVLRPVSEGTLKRLNQSTFDEQSGGIKDFGHDGPTNRSMRGTLENVAARVRAARGRQWRTTDFFDVDATIEAHRAFIAALERVREENGMLLAMDADGYLAEPVGLRSSVAKHEGTHTATYPGHVVEPCIRAGVSAFGVCRDCGAPYERRYVDRQPVGWAPSCDDSTGVARPIVLDPFVGSGTTLEVAHRLGCRGIGVDLSSHYLHNDAVERLGGETPA